VGGTGYLSIVDIEATADEARSLAADVTEWLVECGIVVPDTDGQRYGAGPRCAVTLAGKSGEIGPDAMTVDVERTVFHPGVYHGDEVGCPHCGAVVAMDEMFELVGQWHAGDDGDRACVGCGRDVGINDWAWDPAWAFGHLGFTFHAWGELTPEFVASVGARLGHRVVLVDGYF
jgi:hypothetical protein